MLQEAFKAYFKTLAVIRLGRLGNPQKCLC